MKYFVAIFLSLILFGSVFAQERIDVNTAPLEELVKIIHIGEARALELISLRPFYSLDDLARINGIGPSRLQDIKNQGLAWVSENVSPSGEAFSEVRPPSTEIELGKNGENPGAMITAGVLAVFSGATAVLLKKKLKG